MFVILRGTMIFQIKDETREVGEGGLVWVPRGAPHTSRNSSYEPVRALGIVCRVAWRTSSANTLLTLADWRAVPPTGELTELMEKHGGHNRRSTHSCESAMSILVDENSSFIIQGITGREGR